jgi:hypothetical protein
MLNLIQHAIVTMIKFSIDKIEVRVGIIRYGRRGLEMSDDGREDWWCGGEVVEARDLGRSRSRRLVLVV